MPSHDSPRSNPFPDFLKNNWVWDEQRKPLEVQLSSDKKAAYFYVDPTLESSGAVAVRGTKGLCGGEHYWEVIFLEPPCVAAVMVGVGTEKALLQSEREHENLIGQDSESWGLSHKGRVWHGGVGHKFCEPFFDQGTVIGVHLDLTRGRLTFYKDGVCLGPAFTGLRASKQRPLYPMVSSTPREMELGLGARLYRLGQPSPLEAECLETIRNTVTSVKSLDSLPIPQVMKNYLRDM